MRGMSFMQWRGDLDLRFRLVGALRDCLADLVFRLDNGQSVQARCRRYCVCCPSYSLFL